MIGCGLSGLIVILSLALHFVLEQKNRQRDRDFGAVDENTTVDVTDEGDGNQNFRYLT